MGTNTCICYLWKDVPKISISELQGRGKWWTLGHEPEGNFLL